jgi:hypothetical protein
MSLRHEPDRYQIAYALACEMAFPGRPLTPQARFLEQAHHGLLDEDFLRAVAEGRQVDVSFGRRLGRDDPTQKRWRDKNWANAATDNFERKRRTVKQRLIDDEAAAEDSASDLYWYVRMINGWYLVFRPGTHPNPAAAARMFASEAGELAYYEAMMEPVLLLKANLLRTTKPSD